MISVTTLLFLIKKSPKLLCLIITFINIVMLFFVLNGCTHDSSGYANLYLVEYKFNSNSDISKILSTQYSNKHNGSNISDFKLQVGYMGICIELESDEDIACGYTQSIDEKYSSLIPSFSIVGNSTAGTSLELLKVAESFQKKVMKKEILIVELVFQLILIVVQLYEVLSFLPFQEYVTYFSTFVLGCAFLIIGIIIVWIMVGCYAINEVGELASMEIISVTIGAKVQSVMWAVVALSITEGLMQIFFSFREKKLADNRRQNKSMKNDLEKDVGNVPDSVMSSISTLREAL